MSSCPGEYRAVTETNLKNRVGWKDMSQGICDVILAYKCARQYHNDIKAVQEEIPNMHDKQEFLERMMECIPSDGKQNAFHVLKLFEALLNADFVI
jgi:hypothetical protein